MALATLANVVATVGCSSHNVSLTIEEDGLTVGSFGKLPWDGAGINTEVSSDGLMITMLNGPSATHYFVPVAAFASFGGAKVMKTFAAFVERSAEAAGARIAQAA